MRVTLTRYRGYFWAILITANIVTFYHSRFSHRVVDEDDDVEIQTEIRSPGPSDSVKFPGLRFQYVPLPKDEPRKIWVISYQRCGSSFFGEIFDENPEGFYLYEPLDALYSAMYGVEQGWNVPSEITSFWNGSARYPLPEIEALSVADYINDLLSCKIKTLPTELFLSKFHLMFWNFQDSATPFLKCLKANSTRTVLTECRKHLEHECPFRLGEEEKMNKCMNRLWLQRQTTLASSSDAFGEYWQCITEAEKKIRFCADVMEQVCKAKKVRATKTVRGTMESAALALSRDPNFRIIHLIRDPRAVVLSREALDNSTQSVFSKGDIIKEAALYCRTVVRDVIIRKQLEKIYPGAFLQVIFDDLVLDPVGNVAEIYRFADMQLHNKTIEWLEMNTKKKKDSRSIAEKWQKKISFWHKKYVDKVCKDFYKIVPYNWVIK